MIYKIAVKNVNVSFVVSSSLNLLWDSFWVNYLLKHVNHVIELPVDVTDDYDRFLYSQQVWFIHYDKFRLRKLKRFKKVLTVDFGNLLN